MADAAELLVAACKRFETLAEQIKEQYPERTSEVLALLDQLDPA